MDLQRPLDGRARRRADLAIAVGFVLSVKTIPLYHSNQNTKFLQGLADAWPDLLGRDWTAGTVDGLPAFSGLVHLVARFLDPVVFYVIEAGFLALMGLALVALARLVAPDHGRSLGFTLFAAGLIISLAHSWYEPALRGVAGQYMTDGYLQPSEFGVLFLPALLLAHRGHRAAMPLAAVPAAFHPAYIALAAILVGVMLADRLRKGQGFAPLALATALALLFLPPLDLSMRFAPTDAETFARANDILAFQRIPHHSDPAKWLTSEAIAKLVVALLALRIAPAGVIRNALAALLALAVLGTLFTALTGSAEVALMAPWRSSILIVPVSVALLTGWAGERLLAAAPIRPWARRALIFTGLLGAFAAIQGIGEKYSAFFQRSHADYVAFVQESRGPETVFLTSPDERYFRLQTLTPQFVTWKTHPYKDVEVIAWKHRVDAARAVFGEGDGRDGLFDCAALDRLLADYPEVTHVFARKGKHKRGAAECSRLEQVFDGKDGAVFAVRPRV